MVMAMTLLFKFSCAFSSISSMLVLVFLLLETSSPKISSISMKEVLGINLLFSAYSPSGSVICMSWVLKKIILFEAVRVVDVLLELL